MAVETLCGAPGARGEGSWPRSSMELSATCAVKSRVLRQVASLYVGETSRVLSLGDFSVKPRAPWSFWEMFSGPGRLDDFCLCEYLASGERVLRNAC